MLRSLKAVTCRVADLGKAKEWYRQFFDGAPALDSPLAVVFEAGDSLLTLVPGPPSGETSDRLIAYWDVEDIHAAHQRLLDAGAKPYGEIMTTPAGAKIARVVDPLGNMLGIMSAAGGVKTSLTDRPSQSALVVALCRALAARDEREEIRGPDYMADVFLPEDSKRPLQDLAARRWILGQMQPGGYEFFIARTAFLDRAVREALLAGIPQIVFLGAGYDSRAYRFQDLIGETRLFELDIASTQERKRRMLKQANIPVPPQLRFVPIDFVRQDLAEVLPAAGFETGKKSLFIWEGVCYYLTAQAVDGTLEFIRTHSAAGSELCFDYLADAPDMEERYGVKESLAAMRSMYVAEPMQFRIQEGAIESFLSERGFTMVEHLAAADMERAYLTLADGSPAGRVLACLPLVKASVA